MKKLNANWKAIEILVDLFETFCDWYGEDEDFPITEQVEYDLIQFMMNKKIL